MQEGILVIANIVSLVTVVMGVFFGIRAFYRFKEWRDDNKDELWPFLAYTMSAVGSVLVGIGGIQVFSDLGYRLFYAVLPLFLILGLVAIGLMTYYYYLKWRELK